MSDSDGRYCETCRWWKRWPKNGAMGVCERPTPRYRGLDPAGVFLHRVGWAELDTGPRFGCIHWEARQDG